MRQSRKNPRLRKVDATVPRTLEENGVTFRLVRTYTSHARAVKRAKRLAEQELAVVVEPVGREYALYIPKDGVIHFDRAAFPRKPVQPRSTFGFANKEHAPMKIAAPRPKPKAKPAPVEPFVRPAPVTLRDVEPHTALPEPALTDEDLDALDDDALWGSFGEDDLDDGPLY